MREGPALCTEISAWKLNMFYFCRFNMQSSERIFPSMAKKAKC